MAKRFGRAPRWLRRRPTRRRAVVSRRHFLVQALVLFGAALGLGAHWLGFAPRAPRRAGDTRWRSLGPIRPPMAASSDDAFQRACIRCGLCGTVCKSGCIRYFGLDETEYGAFTPYIDVRDRSCVLCMRCTDVCPTGALTALADDLGEIAQHVNMGTAVVDPDRCLSYLGRICGYCHDACPLPNVAIRLVPQGKPLVLAEGCVGCGRCVELCPQSPTAIDVARVSA